MKHNEETESLILEMKKLYDSIENRWKQICNLSPDETSQDRIIGKDIVSFSKLLERWQQLQDE